MLYRLSWGSILLTLVLAQIKLRVTHSRLISLHMYEGGFFGQTFRRTEGSPSALCGVCRAC